jgi:hypothetical protein
VKLTADLTEENRIAGSAALRSEIAVAYRPVEAEAVSREGEGVSANK